MITVNLDKAKEIVHDIRRVQRAEKFKSLDIEATIPALATEAEAKRQEIRDQFAEIQEKIEAAETPDTLKHLITQCKEA